MRLYKDGVAALLLLSGGGARPLSEAEAMRRLAIDAGVPDSALLVEARSGNTAENAFNSARLLRQRGVERVILVSHRQHLLRARMLFRLAGLQVAGTAGVPAHSAAEAVGAAVYEIAAFPLALARASRRRGG